MAENEYSMSLDDFTTRFGTLRLVFWVRGGGIFTIIIAITTTMAISHRYRSRYHVPPLALALEYSNSRDSLAFMFHKEDEPEEQLIVFFTEESSLGVKPIRQYVAPGAPPR